MTEAEEAIRKFEGKPNLKVCFTEATKELELDWFSSYKIPCYQFLDWDWKEYPQEDSSPPPDWDYDFAAGREWWVDCYTGEVRRMDDHDKRFEASAR